MRKSKRPNQILVASILMFLGALGDSINFFRTEHIEYFSLILFFIKIISGIGILLKYKITRTTTIILISYVNVNLIRAVLYDIEYFDVVQQNTDFISGRILRGIVFIILFSKFNYNLINNDKINDYFSDSHI